jgi:hypothetical protein
MNFLHDCPEACDGGLRLRPAPTEIYAQSQVNFPKNNSKITWDIELYLPLCNLYSIEFAYLLTWGVCAVLLHYYSRMSGKIKYWIIISVLVFLQGSNKIL